MKVSFKNVGKLFLVFLVGLFFIGKVDAAVNGKTCGHHKNYYFFANINVKSYYTDTLSRILDSNPIQLDNMTYFHIEDFDYSSVSVKDQVCLSSDVSPACVAAPESREVMSLTDFYNNYKIGLNGKSETFTSTDGNEQIDTYTYKKVGNEIIGYFTHHNWYVKNGNGYDYKTFTVDLRNNTVDEMTAGSIFPDSQDSVSMELVINSNLDDSDPDKYLLQAKVSRYFSVAPAAPTYFYAAWKTKNNLSFLMPALYKIEYDITEGCETENYNAVINYYYVDDEGNKTPVEDNRVVFDDNSSNPWSKTGLDDGYTEKVTSPMLKGCTPDKGEVNVAINGEDFKENVYYTCSNTYKANIDYYYVDENGKKTAEEKYRVVFDDNSSNPWTKSKLENGYTEKVTSPTLKGCTPDKSSVNVVINNADFSDKVYYTCKAVKSEDTGVIGLGVLLVIAVGALGYLFWYTKNNQKNLNNV